MSFSRREFLTTAVVGSLSLGLRGQETNEQSSRTAANPAGKRPTIITAHNGYNYIDEAFNMLRGGADTLDAALRVVRGPEDDPHDDSVGLGGLPNEDGVVELDACCMHGPTRRAGSVGGVRNIKNVSLVAKAVMEHSGHVMLVGEGAERFAVAQGFPREDLLTEHSRKVWLLYKETHSDWWGPGLADPNWKKRFEAPPRVGEWQLRMQRMDVVAAEIGIPPEMRRDAIHKVLFPPTGTIHCSALNEKGEISGCTTTSGLAWKVPGRVGDSPIIGAGCYSDPDVGSAGATGSGEENIKVVGAHTIIENMRHGMSPLEAGTDALKRIAHAYDNDLDRLRFMDMTYYVLRKDGAWAGVSLWEGYGADRKPHTIVVHDGIKRAVKTVNLFPGFSQDWPPTPGSY
ncbi:MAG: N(4)-(beta-N-acetylglucosaminyl)-L-asparaginase [Acidobacteriia bacterium]|nr:N(4)-(beta-N-acetylglucosaminyl)-L-asparaginase [Terriglobia bacterium]